MNHPCCKALNGEPGKQQLDANFSVFDLTQPEFKSSTFLTQSECSTDFAIKAKKGKEHEFMKFQKISMQHKDYVYNCTVS